MDSRKLALLCRELADNKKAEDIVILDVRELSSVTDYFVIASGTSEPHLRAIVDEITDQLREDFDMRPAAIDGTLQTAWVVLDYFDVIVHVMRQDVRERYDLETLWGDAPRVKARKPRHRSETLKPSRRRYSAGCFGGVSAEALTISSNSFLNSSRPGAGMMMVSRRPPTSSVMRRKRPRGFSFRANTKVFRSIWILSDFRVSSLTGGFGAPKCCCRWWP